MEINKTRADVRLWLTWGGIVRWKLICWLTFLTRRLKIWLVLLYTFLWRRHRHPRPSFRQVLSQYKTEGWKTEENGLQAEAPSHWSAVHSVHLQVMFQAHALLLFVPSIFCFLVRVFTSGLKMRFIIIHSSTYSAKPVINGKDVWMSQVPLQMSSAVLSLSAWRGCDDVLDSGGWWGISRASVPTLHNDYTTM